MEENGRILIGHEKGEQVDQTLKIDKFSTIEGLSNNDVNGDYRTRNKGIIKKHLNA